MAKPQKTPATARPLLLELCSKPEEAPQIAGVDIAWVKEGSGYRAESVTVNGPDGPMLVVTPGQYSGIAIKRQPAPPTETRYILSGTFNGVPLHVAYKTETEATAAGRRWAEEHPGVTLQVVEAQVPVQP